MSKKFVGVSMTANQFVIECIRSAFQGSYFKLSAIHELEGFKYETCAEWVRDWHCKDNIPPEMLSKLKMYVVNYLLCPDADSDLEVIAMMDVVWPKGAESAQSANEHKGIRIWNLNISWERK